IRIVAEDTEEEGADRADLDSREQAAQAESAAALGAFSFADLEDEQAGDEDAEACEGDHDGDPAASGESAVDESEAADGVNPPPPGGRH
ncbi:MAG: hypothetical protein K6U08_08820, partial [Firmicutes bacterium]|nr:hypothetical protein [Bacillota bacterium]